MNKTCTKCGETKPVLEFYRCSSKKDGRQTSCKSCAKAHDKKNRDSNPKEYYGKRRKWREGNRFAYALTQSRWHAKSRGYTPCNATTEELEVAFVGKCEICGVPEAECNMPLHMDHDHETGEFRGFLCARCNMGIGYFKNSEEVLIDALHYLMNTNRKVIYDE